MRERWLGATGRRIAEIVVEGEVDLPDDALVLEALDDATHCATRSTDGRPVVVRADTAERSVAALARPEVSCVVVPAEAP